MGHFVINVVVKNVCCSEVGDGCIHGCGGQLSGLAPGYQVTGGEWSRRQDTRHDCVQVRQGNWWRLLIRATAAMFQRGYV